MSSNISYKINETNDLITINLKLKTSKISFYYYKDDTETCYIAGLYVPKKDRRSGIGKTLLTFCETLGRKLNFQNIRLWVKKDSWVYDWYARQGYTYLKPHEQKEYVWMTKIL